MIATMAVMLNQAGCDKYRTNFEPTVTTYPREPQIQEVSYQLIGFSHGANIGIWNDSIKSKLKGKDRFSYDTYITKTGDDATVETFIHNPKQVNASKRQLLNIAKQRGKEICNGGFAILETTYFFGDEATPGFYGLSNVKSMRVMYRCELKFTESEISKNKDILKLSKQLGWSNFFDILGLDLEKNFEQAIKDLSLAARNHGIKEISSGKLDDNRYFYLGSGDMKVKTVSQRYEQLVAIIEPTAQGSKIRIIFPALCFQNFRTSVSVIRNIPDERGDLVPWARNVAYDRARYFLSNLSNITKQ